MLRGLEDRPQTDHAVLVHFTPAIVLTKDEVFEACAGLADLERLLQAIGHAREASWVETLFERLEERLAAQWPDDQVPSPAFSGSKSSDSELTQ
jgi:hypothetical protein